MSFSWKTEILRTYSGKEYCARRARSKETHLRPSEANEPVIFSNLDHGSIDTNVASCSSQHSGNRSASTTNENEPKKMPEVWFTMSQSELKDCGLHAEVRDGKAVITSSLAQPVSGLEEIIYKKFQQSSPKASERKQPLHKHGVPHTPVESLVSNSKKSDKVVTDTSVGIPTIDLPLKEQDASVNAHTIEPWEMELYDESAELENQSIEKIILKWGDPSDYIRRYQAILHHHWEKSLEQIGYIRCPMQDCNYISLSREDMTNHYADCKNIPQFGKNMCPHCKKHLCTDQDLKKHISITHVSLAVGSASEESSTDVRRNPDKASLEDAAKSETRQLKETLQPDTLGDSTATFSQVPLTKSICTSITTYLTPLDKQEGKSRMWISKLIKKNTDESVISSSSFKKSIESKESSIDDTKKQTKETPQGNNQPKKRGRPRKSAKINDETSRTVNPVSQGESGGAYDIDTIDLLSPELGRGMRKRRKKIDDLFEDTDIEPKRKGQQKSRVVKDSNLPSGPKAFSSQVGEQSGVLENAPGTFKNVDNQANNEDHGQPKVRMEQELDVVQKNAVEEKDEDLTNEEQELLYLNDSDDSECDASGGSRGRGMGRGKGRGKGRGRRVEQKGDGTVRRGRRGGRERGKGRFRGKGIFAKGTKTLMKMSRGARLALVKKEDDYIESDMSPEAVTMIECGKCSEVMMQKCFPRHNREKHMGLGWTEGAEPIDVEDEKLLMRILTKVHLTVRKLICDKCGISKKSAVGFISHLQCCQKSCEERIQLRTPCVICGRLMLPASLKVHMYTVHKKGSASLEKPAESVELLEDDIKTKRVAATKAVTRIQQFIGAEEAQDIDVSCKRNSSPTREELYQKVTAVKITNRYVGAIKRMMTRKGVASCRYPGCDFTSSILEEIVDHNKQCIKKPEEGYACQKCSFHAVEETAMKNHVQEEHADAACSERSDDSESTSSLDDEEDVLFQNKPVEPKSHIRFGRNRTSDGIAYLRQANSGPAHCDRPFYPALNWTVKYHLQNYDQSLFGSQRTTARDWVKVAENEVDGYLPDTRESIAFTSHYWNKKVDSLPENLSSKLKKLKLFEGDIQFGNPVFFAGGPVWCLAWCPLPLKWTIQASARVNQFIAVSCHKSMEAQYHVDESYAHKGLIQIWNLGHLQNKSECSAPVFGMGIAHDYGTVWCMEWCPSGCYDVEERNDETLLRIGLLAAACSDGTVRIYSVCDPAQLEMPENGFKIFKPQPFATLVLDSECETEDKNWQCIRISWHTGEGHRAVAGGFTNGMVAVWSMKFDTQLLNLREGNSQIILPYKVIPAHNGAVTAVALSPLGEEPRYLLTGSADRAVKFWDLQESCSPVTINKKGNSITCGLWLPHWVSGLMGYDDGYGYTHTNSSVHTFRGFGFSIHPLFTQNSVTWDLAANMWLNALAQATEAGELSVMFAHQLLYCADLDRAVKLKRLIISYVDLIKLEKPDGKDEDSSDSNVRNILDSFPTQISNETEGSSAISNISENTVNDISDLKINTDKSSAILQGILGNHRFEIQFMLNGGNELTNHHNLNADEIQVQAEGISSTETSVDNSIGCQNNVHKELPDSETEKIQTCSLQEKTPILERENQDNEMEHVEKLDERQEKQAEESDYEDGNIASNDNNEDISDNYNEDECYDNEDDDDDDYYYYFGYEQKSYSDDDITDLLVSSELLKAEALKDPFFEPHPFSRRFKTSVRVKLQAKNKQEDNPSTASLLFNTSSEGSMSSNIKETQMNNSLKMQAKDYQKLKTCYSNIIRNKPAEDKENSETVIIGETASKHEEKSLQKCNEHTKASAMKAHNEKVQTCSSTNTTKDFAPMNDEPSVANFNDISCDFSNETLQHNKTKECITENTINTKDNNIEGHAEMTQSLQTSQKLCKESNSTSSEKKLEHELPTILFTAVTREKIPNNDNNKRLKDIEQDGASDYSENDNLMNNNIDELVNTETSDSNACSLSMQSGKSQALNSDPSEEAEIDLDSDDDDDDNDDNDDDNDDDDDDDDDDDNDNDDDDGDESLGDFLKPDFVKPEAKTYADAKSDYGVIFCDFPTNSVSEVLPESRSWTSQSDKMRPSEVNAYPILSINRVAWNPNCHSFLWLAAGYQCGLVRMLCYRAMHTPRVDDILRKAAWNVSE